MSKSVEQLLHNIGNVCLDVVGDDNADLIAYTELDESVVSCSIFYKLTNLPKVFYKESSTDLSSLFYTLWLEWGKTNKEYPKIFCYSLFEGKINMEVIYEDKFNPDIDRLERRNLFVEKYFGPSEVVYEENSNEN